MLFGAWSNSKTLVYFSLSKELITYYWSSTLGRKKNVDLHRAQESPKMSIWQNKLYKL